MKARYTTDSPTADSRARMLNVRGLATMISKTAKMVLTACTVHPSHSGRSSDLSTMPPVIQFSM